MVYCSKESKQEVSVNANWSRNAFVYLLIIVAGAALFFNIYRPDEAPQQITLSQLATGIQEGTVDSIRVSGEEVQVIVAQEQPPLITRREADIPLTQTLIGLGVTPEQLSRVEVHYNPPGNTGNWLA